MADILMWHQGDKGVFSLPDCGNAPNFTCPQSKRIAAEYMRDYFFLTNVLNPNWDNEWFGRENWQQDLAREVQVGDTIWFILVPPKHLVYDVSAYAEETLADGSMLSSLAGMQADLVTAVFAEADNNGLCSPTGMQTHASLSFPGGSEPDEVFVQSKVEILTNPKQWIGVGLTITSMPTDTTTLENIRAKIAVGSHVLGYDSQTHM